MALPKAVRFLALVTMIIFGWLVLQIFRAPGKLDVPGKGSERWDDMVRDPNLDRKYRLLLAGAHFC